MDTTPETKPLWFMITLECLKGVDPAIREMLFKHYESSLVTIYSRTLDAFDRTEDHDPKAPNAGYFTQPSLQDSTVRNLRKAYAELKEWDDSWLDPKQIEFWLMPEHR